MTDKLSFSKRKGFFSIKDKAVTIREDAPFGLRNFVRLLFYDFNKKPSDLLAIVSKVLKVAPADNWTEFPNIDNEVKQLIDECEWYLVYDIIEIIINKFKHQDKELFINEINEYFIINGIGWKIEDEEIETRGDEIFEIAVSKVSSILEDANLYTAKAEIIEAMKDLSRRPSPDITGAIQHSLASLECVAREFTGDKKSTLGNLLKKFPKLIPAPLDIAISKIWGFASEKGRHLKEGHSPDFIEAELIVEVVAAISTYLSKKLK